LGVTPSNKKTLIVKEVLCDQLVLVEVPSGQPALEVLAQPPPVVLLLSSIPTVRECPVAERTYSSSTNDSVPPGLATKVIDRGDRIHHALAP
jgi:hypothetical protein